MPTRLTTASAPTIALPAVMSSSKSAWTISGVWASSVAILTRPGWRTARRTVAPCRRSSPTRWRPMKPVPPNTVTEPAMTYLLGIAAPSILGLRPALFKGPYYYCATRICPHNYLTYQLEAREQHCRAVTALVFAPDRGSQVRIRLAAGGIGIRTLGPP